MKFLTSIDLVKNELQNAVIQNLATSPSNAKEGQVYYNTADHTLYQYKGTDGWKPVGTEYTLPIASEDALGGIKVGYGLGIETDGTLKVTGGGTADAVEWANVLNKPDSLSGYGIVDAKIDNGVITLGSDTITPVVSVNGKTGTVVLAAEDVQALPVAGGTMSGIIAMGGNKISGLDTPTEDTDASTKKYVDDTTATVQGNLDTHIANKENPHSVTKEQVGLDKVDNVKQWADSNHPTTLTGYGITDAASDAELNALEETVTTNAATMNIHIANTSNPHSVTKAQVGLDKVDNVKQYSASNEPPYPVTSVDGGTGAVVLNDVKYVSQTLTDAQKTQARTNIGAGTSSFSGSYNDLTNKPTVDTEMKSDSTNAVQNKVIKAYVDGIIAASQGIVYKGTINKVADIPTTYEVGWLYMIATAGTYVGQVCEVGDLMIAVVARQGSGTANSDWDVVQTNIDGAITSIAGTSPITVDGTGASRTVSLNTSGVTAKGYGDTSNQTPAFGATFKVPSFTVDSYGRLTVAGEHTVTIPSSVASGSANGLMESTDYTLLHRLDTRIGTAEGEIDTLQSHMVTVATATLTAGQTSVSATIPTGKTVTNVMFSNATSGEAIMADYKVASGTLTGSITATTTYNITMTYTYM
jgi:hypothetical protein